MWLTKQLIQEKGGNLKGYPLFASIYFPYRPPYGKIIQIGLQGFTYKPLYGAYYVSGICSQCFTIIKSFNHHNKPKL